MADLVINFKFMQFRRFSNNFEIMYFGRLITILKLCSLADLVMNFKIVQFGRFINLFKNYTLWQIY